jgi:hypothetical protein
VPGAEEVLAIGFGKGRGDYPSIVIAGWISGEYGIWLSVDDAVSWTRVGKYPLGILDRVSTIEGDAEIPGRVYVGFGGAGYAFCDERHK